MRMKVISCARSLRPWLFGWSVFVLLGASSCKNHSAISLRPEKSSQAVLQQPELTRLETGQEKSCREFVQEFYNWYASPIKPDRQHKTGELSSDDVLRLKPLLFDEKLF